MNQAKKDEYYVAFTDCLGYESIVNESCDHEQMERRFESCFECLYEATEEAIKAMKPNDSSIKEKDSCDVIAFSDSVIMWSLSLEKILFALQKMFLKVYTSKQKRYEPHDNWRPFVRGGISRGWIMQYSDPTVENTESIRAFRNPVGPGVYRAVKLVEKHARLKGMRCCLERSLIDDIECVDQNKECITVHYNKNVDIKLIIVPNDDQNNKSLDLIELAWPCDIISKNCTSFLEPLNSAKSQFAKTDSALHFNYTIDLFKRSIPLMHGVKTKQMEEMMQASLIPLPKR